MPLPSGIKKVIIPLSFVFFAGVMWVGLFEPQYKKAKEYEEKLSELDRQESAVFRKMRSYEVPTPEEKAEWQRLANELERRIPKGRQLAELYALLSELAQKNQLSKFNRRMIEDSDQELDEGGIKRRSFDLELTFEGEYQSIVAFLADLHSLDRLVEVEQLEVSRMPPLVGVRMVLRSYYSS